MFVSDSKLDRISDPKCSEGVMTASFGPSATGSSIGKSATIRRTFIGVDVDCHVCVSFIENLRSLVDTGPDAIVIGASEYHFCTFQLEILS